MNFETGESVLLVGNEELKPLTFERLAHGLC